MFSLVRVPTVNPEMVRVEAGFSSKGCWVEPRRYRHWELVKARWDGVEDA